MSVKDASTYLKLTRNRCLPMLSVKTLSLIALNFIIRFSCIVNVLLTLTASHIQDWEYPYINLETAIYKITTIWPILLLTIMSFHSNMICIKHLLCIKLREDL